MTKQYINIYLFPIHHNWYNTTVDANIASGQGWQCLLRRGSFLSLARIRWANANIILIIILVCQHQSSARGFDQM